MLGLTSHEPNFSLLREEVRFGGKKSQKRCDMLFCLSLVFPPIISTFVSVSHCSTISSPCFLLFVSIRITAPEETTFHLLHLSLMREYIDYEFSGLRVRHTHAYTHANRHMLYCFNLFHFIMCM